MVSGGEAPALARVTEGHLNNFKESILSLEDVYDDKEYYKSQNYKKENFTFSMIISIFSFIIGILIALNINNRNLKTFKVDLDNSIKLADQIPDTSVKISESGISDPRIIMGLKEYGFQGFLIGENFMKSEDPGLACQEFISQIR